MSIKNLLYQRIETQRTLLIPISMDYAEAIFTEFTPAVAALMYPRSPKNISETEEFISKSLEGLKEGRNFQLVVISKDFQEFFGCAGLHNIDTRTPEMGIWIKISAHGKRYGREAMIAIKHWADDNLDYDYILYPVADNNLASRKIPEALGGRIEREYETQGLGGNKYHCLEYRIFPKKNR